MSGNEEGWVKLHRKLLDWGWANDPNMMSLWMHILLNSNYEPSEYRGIKLKAGQLIYGRKAWSERTGISERSLRTCIERLKSTNEVTIQATSKFTILTVVKWEEYQSKDGAPTNKTTKSATSDRPATDQRPTTYKEGKKLRNKEYTDADSAREIFFHVCERLRPLINSTTPLNFSPVMSWIDEGCDLEMDIVPTVEAIMAKRQGNPPNSISYFAKAAFDARDARINPPQIRHTSNTPPSHQQPKPEMLDAEEYTNAVLARFRESEGVTCNA